MGTPTTAVAALRTFLVPYPAEVRALMLAGRRRLLELLGPATDLIYDATSAVGAGFSYTGNPRDNVVNLAAYADHVTLVFPWGVKLKDPKKRLRGEGNQVRHVRLANLADLDDPVLVKLIEQAAALAPRGNAPPPRKPFIKVYAGPKRRPSLRGAQGGRQHQRRSRRSRHQSQAPERLRPLRPHVFTRTRSPAPPLQASRACE